VFDFTAGDVTAIASACENVDKVASAEIVKAVFDAGSVLEIQKGFSGAVYAGFATLAGFPVGFVAAKGELGPTAAQKRQG
jgi:acetyl-CoA carboxylase carboxyltransferase component